MYEIVSLKEVREKDTNIKNSGNMWYLQNKGNKQMNKQKTKKQRNKKLNKHCTLVDTIMHTHWN